MSDPHRGAARARAPVQLEAHSGRRRARRRHAELYFELFGGGADRDIGEFPRFPAFGSLWDHLIAQGGRDDVQRSRGRKTPQC